MVRKGSKSCNSGETFFLETVYACNHCFNSKKVLSLRVSESYVTTGF